jgi:Holliday junction DNA helicase RuvA
MIGKLTGIVEHCLEDSMILNVNGIGYIIIVPTYVLHQTKLGEQLSLFIEMIMRPEMVTLYGFKDFNEKTLFQKLMSVQGIGGKSAAAILSIMTPDQILEAIVSQDVVAFKRADGVGPKVATRILTELKEYALKQGAAFNIKHRTSETSSAINVEDALSTLLQLGYKRYEAQQALQKAIGIMPEATTEQLIPVALKLLARLM